MFKGYKEFKGLKCFIYNTYYLKLITWNLLYTVNCHLSTNYCLLIRALLTDSGSLSADI